MPREHTRRPSVSYCGIVQIVVGSADRADLEPTSYVNYYKRATAYLSLGRHSAALDDFDHILRLNPAFVQVSLGLCTELRASHVRISGSQIQAHLQKAKILAKEGDFAQANEELKAYSRVKKNEDEAEQLVSRYCRLSCVRITLSEQWLTTEQAESVNVAASASKAAQKAAKGKRWSDCVEKATSALEVGPNSGSLRQLRIQCATELGDPESVFADLR